MKKKLKTIFILLLIVSSSLTSKADSLPKSLDVTVLENAADVYKIPFKNNRFYYVFYRNKGMWMEKSLLPRDFKPTRVRVFLYDTLKKGSRYGIYQYRIIDSKKAKNTVALQLRTSYYNGDIDEDAARKLVGTAQFFKTDDFKSFGVAGLLLLIFLLFGKHWEKKK